MFPIRAILSAFAALVLWISAVAWLYGGAPTSMALGMFAGPFLLLAAAGVALAFRRGKDLPKAAALLLPLAAGVLGFRGASELRLQQKVAARDLVRIRLDRRADASGERPRSTLQYREKPSRAVILTGVVANDNDFPLWQVDLEVRVLYEDGGEALSEVLSVRGDIPAHGAGPVLWTATVPARFVEGEVPSWEARVVGAKRHWGGGT